MTKLTKVEIVGKPEITRDGSNAQMHIKVRVSPQTLASGLSFRRTFALC